MGEFQRFPEPEIDEGRFDEGESIFVGRSGVDTIGVEEVDAGIGLLDLLGVRSAGAYVPTRAVPTP